MFELKKSWVIIHQNLTCHIQFSLFPIGFFLICIKELVDRLFKYFILDYTILLICLYNKVDGLVETLLNLKNILVVKKTNTSDKKY